MPEWRKILIFWHPVWKKLLSAFSSFWLTGKENEISLRAEFNTYKNRYFLKRVIRHSEVLTAIWKFIADSYQKCRYNCTLGVPLLENFVLPSDPTCFLQEPSLFNNGDAQQFKVFHITCSIRKAISLCNCWIVFLAAASWVTSLSLLAFTSLLSSSILASS